MEQYSASNQPGLKRHLTRANLKRIWIGPQGLRSGWAALLFWALVAAMLAGVMFVLHHLLHSHDHSPPSMTLRRAMIGETAMTGAGVLATIIMSKIDRRSWLDYGLRTPRRFMSFVQGVGIGVVSLSILISALYALHVIHIERSTISIGALVEQGLIWIGVFFLVGLSEEIIFRGYAFFRLFGGTRPWIAGVISSLVFAAAHTGNDGETVVGVISVVGAGLLLCFLVWRTNSLWLAIGFHTSWDWSQTFIFGVADSGAVSTAHWLTSQTSGPAWLSGGTVGPEGSFLMLPLLIVVALLASRFLPARQESAAVR